MTFDDKCISLLIKTYRFGVFFNLKRSNENSLIKTPISPLQFELWSEQMCIDLSLEITSLASSLARSLSASVSMISVSLFCRTNDGNERMRVVYMCCKRVRIIMNNPDQREREREKETNDMNNPEKKSQGAFAITLEVLVWRWFRLTSIWCSGDYDLFSTSSDDFETRSSTDRCEEDIESDRTYFHLSFGERQITRNFDASSTIQVLLVMKLLF